MMDSLLVMLITVAGVSFVVYVAAMQWLFTRPDGVRTGMRVLSICGAVSAVVHVSSLLLLPCARRVAGNRSRSVRSRPCSVHLGVAHDAIGAVTTRVQPRGS